MFGYVRPFKAMLLVCEYEEYKAVYCTLCKNLGKHYNVIMRMMLNYDLSFYTMLALDKQNICPKVKKGRCVVNPLKRCNYINEENDAYHKGSALTVLMTYHKLLDNIADEGFWSSLGARLLLPLVKGSAKKAKKEFPKMNEVLEKMTKMQNEVEKNPDASIDACCQPTAQALSEIFSDIADNEDQKAVISQMGYFLGRWIYTIDAIDDLKKDLVKNSFNPLRKHFNITSNTITNEQQDDIESQVNEMLNNNVARILPAFNLIDSNRYENIMRNILEKGLPQMQKEILFLHLKDKERKKIYDRSI